MRTPSRSAGLSISAFSALLVALGCSEPASTRDASTTDAPETDARGTDAPVMPLLYRDRLTSEQWDEVVRASCFLSDEGAPEGAALGEHEFVDWGMGSWSHWRSLRYTYLEGATEVRVERFQHGGTEQIDVRLTKTTDGALRSIAWLGEPGGEQLERLEYSPAVPASHRLHDRLWRFESVSLPHFAEPTLTILSSDSSGSVVEGTRYGYDEHGLLAWWERLDESGAPVRRDELPYTTSVNAEGERVTSWPSEDAENYTQTTTAPDGTLRRTRAVGDAGQEGTIDVVTELDARGRRIESSGRDVFADQNARFVRLYFYRD